jgi:hypothetical protein
MKIKTNDTMHTAIRKICGGSTRAGSIVMLLQREYPESAMAYLKIIDSKGLYGQELADFYFNDCRANVDKFLEKISNGRTE